MGALYMLSGALAGIAGTAIAMGGDGRIGALFIAAVGLAAIGARLEYLAGGGR